MWGWSPAGLLRRAERQAARSSVRPRAAERARGSADRRPPTLHRRRAAAHPTVPKPRPRPPGQIGYALCPMVAAGRMLGPDQKVVLHLLDIPPAAQALEGVKMELLDAAFPLLEGESMFTG